MPIYDYDCHTCGPFATMRPMAQFRAPGTCPDCGADAPRLFSAPALGRLDPSALSASERRASSEGSTKAAHPAGCGCCARRAPIPGALASKGRVFSSNGPVRGSQA